jgi:hypothetical protein
MLRWLNGKDSFDGYMSLEMYYIDILDQLIYYANMHVTALSSRRLY